MAQQDAQDHNLPASQRKIKKAREEGQVPRSRDLAHAAVLAGLLLLAWIWLPGALEQWRIQLIDGLRFDARSLAQADVLQRQLADQGLRLARALALIGAVLGGAAIASQLALGGWNFTLKSLGPRWSLMDPIAGFGRLFSGHNAGQALKGSVLALLLAAVAAWALHQHVGQTIGLMSVPLEDALGQAGRLVSAGLMALLMAVAVFAAIDVPLQRQLYLRRLRMSRIEVKQEHKETEGSPEIKQRQRARMRELTRQRMMAAVPKADLVVMNPSHYAVALRYEEGQHAAPIVVAKGIDLLAMRIRDVAKEHRVPVLQAPALARALYAHGKLDREVPLSLFAAVAQVLAYIYQLRAAMAGRGQTPEQPTPQVPPELDPHNKPHFRSATDLDGLEDDEE